MGWTAEDFADAIGTVRREFAGAIRRMKITRSDTGIWQTLGHVLFDIAKPETREVETFPGIGIFARPPDGGEAEAVVVQVGGPNNPAIVGMRDEGTRKLVDDVKANETALYNSVARVHVMANGMIQLGPHALTPGTGESAVKGESLMSAMNTLIGAISTAVGGIPGGGAAATAILTARTAFDTAASTFMSTVVKLGG